MASRAHRHERLAAEIRQEIQIMLEGELKDPRLEGAISVSEVRLAPDLRLARVYVVVEGGGEEQRRTLAGLEAASGYIRHELTERLQLRPSPRLVFTLDRAPEYGARIEHLLDQVRRGGDEPE
jgi:ribosome-binding factor A